MPTPSRRRTITLRDGARLALRPITPEDKPLLVASFERLSEQSRYRRFFTTINEISPAQLDYLVDVDHSDHEAIVAIDPSSGEALGVARYIRSADGEQGLAPRALQRADCARGIHWRRCERLTSCAA